MKSRERDVARRMLELRADQHAKASASAAFAGIPMDELRAIRKLAVDTWGERASIANDPKQPGVVVLGFFHSNDDRHLPPHQRRETVVARGRSHRALLEQIRLWRTHT